MKAFVRMMPRIEAAEKLARVEAAALSHNVAFESEIDRQRMIDALRDKASGADALPPKAADPTDLAGMGIGLVMEGEHDHG